MWNYCGGREEENQATSGHDVMHETSQRLNNLGKSSTLMFMAPDDKDMGKSSRIFFPYRFWGKPKKISNYCIIFNQKSIPANFTSISFSDVNNQTSQQSKKLNLLTAGMWKYAYLQLKSEFYYKFYVTIFTPTHFLQVLNFLRKLFMFAIDGSNTIMNIWSWNFEKKTTITATKSIIQKNITRFSQMRGIRLYYVVHTFAVSSCFSNNSMAFYVEITHAYASNDSSKKRN